MKRSKFRLHSFADKYGPLTARALESILSRPGTRPCRVPKARALADNTNPFS
jgi:hypothetical protein